ncbi:hypothetical protein LSAT2_012649 [Lamellibrachia satsuma]|nr:hypothetical protein LSAT2_012649 [Lamellibrachia satsuma]
MVQVQGGRIVGSHIQNSLADQNCVQQMGPTQTPIYMNQPQQAATGVMPAQMGSTTPQHGPPPTAAPVCDDAAPPPGQNQQQQQPQQQQQQQQHIQLQQHMHHMQASLANQGGPPMVPPQGAMNAVASSGNVQQQMAYMSHHQMPHPLSMQNFHHAQ